MIRELTHSELRWKFEFEAMASDVLEQKRRPRKSSRIGFMSQERALAALELGLGIKQRGFNIFVVGLPGTGRTSTVNQILAERAKKEDTPDDIVLLYNFADRDRPLAVSIPASMGPKVKKTYDLIVERLLNNLEKAFDAERFLSERQDIENASHEKTESLLKSIEEQAQKEGFVLTRNTASLTITPANKKGEALSEDEFNQLDQTQKEILETRAEKLESQLEDAIRRVRVVEKETEDAIAELERKTAQRVIEPLFENARAQWKPHDAIVSHLDALQEDVLSHLRHLIANQATLPDENTHGEGTESAVRYVLEEDEFDPDESILLHYKVNVLVTRPKAAGAPVVHETHPTSSNLIGRIEQRLHRGETITDFTRIRAGALYRANGGYLVIEAQDLLRDPSAWEGIKRALKNRAIELDDPGEPGRMVSVVSLRPEPVPLSLKVILIGTPDLYYALSKNDPDFNKLFKVKADFDLEMERSKERIQKYLQFLSAICAEEKLRTPTPAGAGRMLEHAVRLSGSQKKLTARIGEIADLAREANYWASKEKEHLIDARHVRRALEARSEREGFIQSRILEDIVEGRIHIETDGAIVGQCNALTVIELGNYEFGLPLRVTCRVSSGRGEIIDIERETELGGPIHTKGTLIIRGLLMDRFGRDVPLGLTALLCMEQTYSEVDGDSASLAEACTLFSSLANAPISQHFAITGSVDQRGKIQAVGGINEKIEGFFSVCKNLKSKNNGVIIPASSVLDVMLNEEVTEACKRGEFKVYAVETLEDALFLLTGRKWDEGKDALKPTITETLEHLQRIRFAPRLGPLKVENLKLKQNKFDAEQPKL
jgi:predicted ATP-dependent protease